MRGEKFEIEFFLKGSVQRIYDYFVDPNLMKLWLCKNVVANDRAYTLSFGADEDIQLHLKQYRAEHFIRYKWVDYKDNQSLEFKFHTDEISNELSLIIYDYADAPEEIEEEKMFWRKAINQLHNIIGI